MTGREAAGAKSSLEAAARRRREAASNKFGGREGKGEDGISKKWRI